MIRLGLGFLIAASFVSSTLADKMPARKVPTDAPSNAYVAYSMTAEKSPEDFCKRQLDFAKKQDPKTKNACGAFATKATIAVAEPWAGVRLIQLDEHSTSVVPLVHYVKLLAETGGKWFEAQLGHISVTPTVDGSITVTSAAVKDVVPGGKAELVVEFSWGDRHDIGRTDESSTMRYFVLLCGFGKTDAPSCVTVNLGEETKTSRHRLAWSIDKKNQLVLKAVGAFPKNLKRAEYETTRPLYFL